MSREVVLDIETQNTFADVGGYFPEKLDISVVVAYFYHGDTYESYLQADLPKLFERLEHCDRIIGYNSIGFDIPILNKYYSGDLFQVPQLDMLQKIHESLGYRIKLDDVAAASIGTRKSAHGLQAVQWWKEGKINEITTYCQQDVLVTKEVYEFGKKNRYVLFDDRTGERRVVPVDFLPVETEKAELNFTLGF